MSIGDAYILIDELGAHLREHGIHATVHDADPRTRTVRLDAADYVDAVLGRSLLSKKGWKAILSSDV